MPKASTEGSGSKRDILSSDGREGPSDCALEWLYMWVVLASYGTSEL